MGEEQMHIIHQLFYEQVKATPDLTAVSHGERQVTYQELNARSNQLAHFLQEQGVTRSEPIAIMVDKSVEMIQSLFGILKAGAAFVPLDPSYPNDRLEMIFADVRPKWIITQQAYAEKVREFQGDSASGLRMLFLDDLFEQVASYRAEDLPVINEPDDMNYILFTSGSTGRPKGVMGCHKSLVHFVNWQSSTFQIGVGDRVSQFAALTFDPCLRDIFTPLCNGGTSCLPDRDTILNREELVQWLERERISVIHCVPSLFRHFLSEVQTFDEAVQAETFSSLRYIFLGGEALEVKHVRQWKEIFGDRVQLVNFYGPTEVTMIKMFHVIKDLPQEGKSVPIGKAIKGAVPLILNEKNKLCGIWQVGEICIASEYLSLGYYKRPELTQEVFIQNPLQSKKAERVYRTGDLGRYLPDGTVEYVGRKDFQIKVRGFRVELPEIELVLNEHPALREAAVVARQDEAGDYTIIAYFTGDDSALTADELRAFLLKKLPEYMVPSQFHALETMPLNPNGKIDRKFLRESMLQGKQLEATVYVAPSTKTETSIAAIWSDVLKTDKIGVKDNFFNIGGHSLLAMQIFARLRDETQANLELKDLFDYQTVEELARHIDSLPDSGNMGLAAAVKALPKQESYELSHAQQRLWFLFKMEPENIAYNMPFTLTLKGNLDVAALDRAYQKMIERHGSLRTIFTEIDDQPRQVVLESVESRIEHADVTVMPDEKRSEYVQTRIEQDLNTAFDLTNGPLVRSMLFKTGEMAFLFYLNIHHIVSDGWSMGLFFQELGQLYEGMDLPPLEVAYVDFAAWQNELTRSGEMDKQEQYWLKTLAKPLPVLNLPLDRERPAVQTYNGDAVQRLVDLDLLGKIREFAQQENTSLYMVLLAAYNLLLHHLTGDGDLIVGTPIAGRPAAQLEGLVGFFVNTLAVRTRMEGVTSFRDLLAQVKARSLEAYEHQHYPFDMLIEKVNPERDLSRSPIFSTMFVLQNMPFGLPFQALDAEMNPTDNKTAKFDLHLAAGEIEAGLGLLFTYNTDLFDRETVANFAEQYAMLLQAVAENADVPLYEYDLLTARDHRILQVMNATDVTYDLDQTMIEAFIRQAEAHPERVALKYLGQEMTYGELHERSNRIAHFLREQGVQRNELVAIMTERSLELMAGLYGILKAGAAYVPVDPEYPAARVQYMITDCEARVLLTKRAYQQEIVEIASGVEHLKTLAYLDPDGEEALHVEGVATYAWKDLFNLPTSTLPILNTPDDIAYMIYTSGSTGQPKGVVIKHRAIINRMSWHQDVFQASPSDTAIQRTTQCFDDSISELFWPLRHGAKLLIISNEVITDPERLVEQIVSENVTYMQFVPSLFSIVVSYLQNLGSKRPELPLRNIIVSGEALPSTLVNKWFGMFPNGAKLGNLYGPTEAAIDVTCWLIEGPIDSVHIGKPISNTQIYIVNKQGKLCPVGVKGELLVGGVQLANGYHNKPEKTAEAFIPNHLPGTPGDCLYRTGDLARILPDGNIEYLGRIDNQVKVRGFRIELGEIEEVLSQHADVEMAAVIVKKSPDGSNMLFAYYTSKRADLEAAELKLFIGEKTPDYMVPSRLVRLDEMPITPNGKIDRKVLEAWAAEDTFALERVFVAPSTPTQAAIAAIWSDVLERPEISVTDGFFDLGGHSLLAIQIFNRIQKEFAVKLQLKDLFTYSTLEKLADHVDARLSAGTKKEAAAIPKAPRRDHYELSRAQKRLWILYKLNPASKVYNITANIMIEGELNIPAFENALEQLVARHDSLRTIFTEIDGHPRQVIQQESAFRLVLEDLTSLATSERKQAAKARIDACEAVPFNLTEGPLFRAMLLKHEDGKHQFYVSMHHIITDGWSTNIFVSELSELYAAAIHQREPQLAPLTVQYADYAEWQEQELQKGSFAQEEAYWLNTLAKPLPVLELPTDYPRPELQTHDGALVWSHASKELTEQLRAIAKQQDVSMFMLLFSAYLMLLRHLTQQEDLIVGTPIAGRLTGELEPIIGFFVNTLAVRVRFDGIKTLQDLAGEVKRVMLDAYANQSYPFDLLIEKLNPDRDMSRSPIFSTLFVYENEPGAATGAEQIAFTQMQEQLEHSIAKFDLSLTLVEGDAGMRIGFEYNTSLFAKETVERFADSFVKVLHAFTDALQEPIATLDLMTDASRGVYAEMNSTAAEYNLDQLLLDAFTEQAEQYPDRIALSYEGATMTYGELHARSNKLAHFLRAQGVQRNQLVGILMERGLEMMVGLYGIVKAGAAYVPIDPDYPSQRVQYMMTDSGAAVLLTKRVFAEQVREIAEGLPALKTLLYMEPTEMEAIPAIEGINLFAWNDLNGFSTATPENVNDPSDLAYMIYTSGSTGQPKGVVVPHRAIVNRLLWHQEQFQATPQDVIAQRTSVCFDVSVWELFWAMRHGAKLSIVPVDTVKDPHALYAHLVREGVTVMHFVPSLFSNFVFALQNKAERALPKLRWVVTSGEALPAKTVNEWFALFLNGAKIGNLYGPTEAAVDVSCHVLEGPVDRVLIGKPIANTQLYVVDPNGSLCPVGVKGELLIGGVQLANGYHNKPDKTAESFIQNHLPNTPGDRLYRTGDLARVLPTGEIEYLGRRDNQVKVRGFRIELGEVEEAMAHYDGIEIAAVIVQKGPDNENMMVAFYSTVDGAIDAKDIRAFLSEKMPAYMVPSHFKHVEKMPLSPNGKVDRKVLAAIKLDHALEKTTNFAAAATSVEQTIIAIWADVLQRDPAAIGIHDNFFDIGGHSLLLTKAHDAITKQLGVNLPVTDLFKHPTVKSLADALALPEPQATIQVRTGREQSPEDNAVAIIGIGLRYPEAKTPHEFWQNLREGRESIKEFPLDELEPTPFNQDPEVQAELIRMCGWLDDIDQFDPGFFGMTEKEARMMDPQHRVFLECAWEAIENAGYNVDDIDNPVSVYAGVGMNEYLTLDAVRNGSLSKADLFQAGLSNGGKFLPTKVAYKFNLTGEAMLVDTACSTSLVAVHMACKSLLAGDSDFALAGGVSIQMPQKKGYVYEPGFIYSNDGHCRAFDKDATGTSVGSGAGVVFLKRLADAKRDGDPVYAVIRGSAINNDGNVKVGYTAPSERGQTEVILKAQAVAGVSPEDISYVETHGTATSLGDPIEVAALTQAFRMGGSTGTGYCGIGSVKTNIGHTDAAAGVAGLIKVALSLKYGELPPSLHFREPNPAIDFESSPFFVNASLRPWTSEKGPRRAGVSAFGIGGTNAHVIVEEAPADEE